jgi:hypothetical protein
MTSTSRARCPTSTTCVTMTRECTRSGVPISSCSSITPHPTWPLPALAITGIILLLLRAERGPNQQLQQHHSSPNMATAGPGHHRYNLINSLTTHLTWPLPALATTDTGTGMILLATTCTGPHRYDFAGHLR